jgi:rRNA maturation RNase YbeY
MDNIQYEFIDVEIPDFNPEFFSLWLNQVVDDYQKTLHNICFVFCSDDYLLNINNEHLNHDFFTDVVTFNYNEGSLISGDVFISIERVRENAVEFGDGVFFNELCRVMVHGVLHLLGFNDKTDEEERAMREEETKNLIKR